MNSLPVVIAALGDVHASAALPWSPTDTDLALLAHADLVLIAGDITDTGLAADATRVAEQVAAATSAPICAVLGNHDHQVGDADAVSAAVRTAGCQVLDPGSTIVEVRGIHVGVAGTKGFWGSGWRDMPLGLDGEAELAAIERGLTRETMALAAQLRSIREADVRIALLHYSPTTTTLDGERDYVLPFLGGAALGMPALTSAADLVVHGHSHRGRGYGRIGPVPVRNVALPANGNAVSRIEIAAGRESRDAT